MPKVRIETSTGPVLEWLVAKGLGYTPGTVSYHSMGRGFVDTPAPHPFYKEAGPEGFEPTKDHALAVKLLNEHGIETLCNRPARPKHKDPAWRVADWFGCAWHRRSEHFHGPDLVTAGLRALAATLLKAEHYDIPDDTYKELTCP